MYEEYFHGMTHKTLFKALKNFPLLIFAIGLGILYLTVCLMDWFISRIQYYSKLNLNRAKNRVYEFTG
jgi:hypothetical protein